jgi:hypothetical protein
MDSGSEGEEIEDALECKSIVTVVGQFAVLIWESEGGVH